MDIFLRSPKHLFLGCLHVPFEKKSPIRRIRAAIGAGCPRSIRLPTDKRHMSVAHRAARGCFPELEKSRDTSRRRAVTMNLAGGASRNGHLEFHPFVRAACPVFL